MQIAPYLNFDGRCGEALAFYAKALGGSITHSQTFADSPMKDQVPPEWQHKIMHATLVVAGQTLYGADPPPAHYKPSQGFSLSIGVASPEEGERVFAALTDGGEVRMPFSKTFWSAGFGMVVDRFGIAWMINCDLAPA